MPLYLHTILDIFLLIVIIAVIARNYDLRHDIEIMEKDGLKSKESSCQ